VPSAARRAPIGSAAMNNPRCINIVAYVRRGGHNVRRADVLHRFERGWTNFNRHYRPLGNDCCQPMA